jgi:hypothetical protein
MLEQRCMHAKDDSSDPVRAFFYLALGAKWEPKGTLGLAPGHVRVGPQSQTLECQCATASASACAES